MLCIARSNQDNDVGVQRPTDSVLRREPESTIAMRPLTSPLMRRSPLERRSPPRKRSPGLAFANRPHSPAYMRRSRSPYSRRSPPSRRSPYEDRPQERNAYDRPLETYQALGHEIPIPQQGLPSGAFQAHGLYESRPTAHVQGGMNAGQMSSSYYGHLGAGQSFYSYNQTNLPTGQFVGYPPSGGVSHSGANLTSEVRGNAGCTIPSILPNAEVR